MASDLTRIAKGAVRALIAIAAGALVGYEYYSFSPNPNAVLGIAIVMGIVTVLVVFYVLSSLGKHG